MSKYDTYDALIVAVQSIKDARMIEPDFAAYTWSNDITVKLIGKAINGTKRGIILESFMAG